MTRILYQTYSNKPCINCNEIFTPFSSVHKFCCSKCKGEYKYTVGKVTTDGQYKKISGNWHYYLQRLLHKKSRKEITFENLVDLIESQNYTCAISGQPLTCELVRGTISTTNASIDRIVPSKGYTLSNIRLVCRIANVMKWTMSDKELQMWCERILEHAKKS